MIRKLIAAAIPLALAAFPATAGPPKVNHFTVVDGETFRVAVRGAEVLVVSKAAIVQTSIATRDRMRLAVRQATGCTIEDEMPFASGRLRGKLACPVKR